MGCTPEPFIWSCDTGQGIPFFMTPINSHECVKSIIYNFRLTLANVKRRLHALASYVRS